MKMTFPPQTYLGQWSARFAGIFLALFALAQIVAAVGRSQGAFEPERSRFYAISFPAILLPAEIAGIAALIAGVISVIKYKERSLSVCLAILIGFSVLIFALGEILFTH